MNIVDLHVHSTKSDGTYSPTGLVDYAIEKGLSAFALTDHDTVDGLEEAIAYAEALRGADAARDTAVPSGGAPTIPEVIPGIELSTEYGGKDIHIVGLYIDYKNPTFATKLQEFVESRNLRNEKMCALLRERGIEITYQALLEEYPDAVITRAHYAKWMLKNGYIKSMNEAFERYVGDHAPCYVPREKITPAQAVKLILDADGIPVLAHPTLYHMSTARLEKLLVELKAAGLLAMECIYSTYSTSEEREMRTLAAKHGLLISGGSDFHGENKPGLDLAVGYGKLFIPEEVLNNLKKARRYALFTDMDGTLLLKDSTISPAMHDCIMDFCEKGNHLILTTGRPLPSVLEVKEAQGLHHPGCRIAIAYNGALIYDCDAGKELSGHRLSPEDVRFVVGEAGKWGLHVHTYAADYIIAKKWNKELEFYTRRIHLDIKYTDDLAGATEAAVTGQNVGAVGPYKIQCISLDNRRKLIEFRDYLMPLVGDRMTLLFSNEYYLEFLPKGAGKGNALEFVRDYLHLPISHTYAAGDEENDISMIEAAGCGIAMSNASEIVKEAADMVTEKDNNHDGLAEVICELSKK